MSRASVALSPSAPTALARQPACLHFIDGSQLYASCGARILSAASDHRLVRIGRLPIGPVDWLISSVRPLARLLRKQIAHIVPFRDRLVVFGFGRIWCLASDSGALLATPVPISGSRPLAVCRTDHGIYYGEYRSNRERGPIHVYFSEDGSRWSVVHELKSVRHVHGIFADPHTGSLWMTTGDSDDESAIWRTTDRFASLEPVLAGSQQTRAIGLLFTADHVYFGSDTPDEPNHIYRLARRDGSVERLAPVEGSVFFAASAGDWLLFSTAVEPSKVNMGSDSVLYGTRDGRSWHELARHRKDRWSARYFQYGQLPLPAGDNRTGRYWFSAFATDGDGQILSGEFHVR